MAKLTIALGAILIVLGIVSWIVTGFASWTALIPAILGVLLVVFGIVGLRRPRIGVHVALVVALVGLIGTFMNVLQLGALVQGTAERPVAVIASTITFALLLVYLVLGVRSFVRARRDRAPAAG